MFRAKTHGTTPQSNSSRYICTVVYEPYTTCGVFFGQAFVGRDTTIVPEIYKENFDVSSEGHSSVTVTLKICKI
jgi:hypothetical protein